MPIMSSNSKVLSSRCLQLQVCAPDDSVRTHQLPEGQVLVIGTSPACGLRLDGPAIAGMHCTLEFNNGAITVRDWSTESGTYLDGNHVDEQTVRSTQFELRISGYLLQCRLVAVTATTPAGPASTTAHAAGSKPAAPAQTLAGQPVTSGEPQQPPLRQAEPATERQAAKFSSELTEDDAGVDDDAWDRNFDPWERFEGSDSLMADASHDRVTDRLSRNGLHDDTAELLQAEVEFLRSELAGRDERLRTLEEFAATDLSAELSAEMVAASDVEKLVERLEQLLAELEQSDARTAALSEMLRTAEDAVQAADQEREQLEGWLGEVDQRVGQWEQEWHAERDSMRRQIAELTNERDRAEQQLTAGGTDVASGAATDRLVRQLRDEYGRLKAAFLKTEQERDRLRLRLKEASVADVEQKVATAVDSALREERLQLAQEKASMAREKASLAKIQEELQAQLDRKAQTVDSADHRIRAFREHLREIDESEPHRRQVPTLSQRMGKLWRKLEGRPLDTD